MPLHIHGLMEGSSMEPNLCDGDRLRFGAPDGEVERWELVLFRFPLDEQRTFLKRVVGLPGETLEVRDGVVVVDGTPVPDDVYALAPANYAFGPKRIPAGQYFVLGDNRRNSFDSHAWGDEQEFLPRDNILGVLPADTRGCAGRMSG